MERYVMNGGRPLSGKVKIESAKNSVLPILCATVLIDKGETVIFDCPKISDVLNMCLILNNVGLNTRFENENLIISGFAENCSYSKKLGCSLRSSILMSGVLLSKLKRAVISYPGGCAIGERPIDLHIKVLRSFGADIVETEEGVVCSAEKLKGCEIFLSYPSVGATENAILTGVKAEGKTVIHNGAKEPEIDDLIRFLNCCGAKIRIVNGDIVIYGVNILYGVGYKTIPDRIETWTYIIASLMTRGEIELYNTDKKIILDLQNNFCNITCKCSKNNDIIYLKKTGKISPFDITTGPYPLFPTDIQPQATSLATILNGKSTITENVFENRFGHIYELIKMGAKINVKGKTATVLGVEKLHGEKVFAKDLRCGASLILAGLVAEGSTEIFGLDYIKRGYLDIDKKLSALGVDIKVLN